MENMIHQTIQLQQELNSLPREYSQITARKNRDIISEMIPDFNIGRFLVFLDNYKKGIPDKVRITKYGIDGPPTISILLFDGNLITHVVDPTRNPGSEFYNYYGYEIVKDRREGPYETLLDYKLITLDKKIHTILTIWAGYPEPSRL